MILNFKDRETAEEYINSWLKDESKLPEIPEDTSLIAVEVIMGTPHKMTVYTPDESKPSTCDLKPHIDTSNPGKDLQTLLVDYNHRVISINID